MDEKDLLGTENGENQEEELDIDALFAKMMAEKAASGELVTEEAILAEEEIEPEEVQQLQEAVEIRAAEAVKAEPEPFEETEQTTDSFEEAAKTTQMTDNIEKLPQTEQMTDSIEELPQTEQMTDHFEELPKSTQTEEVFRETTPAAKPRKRFLTFSRKMLMLCLVPMIGICFLITFYSTSSLRTSVESEIEKALQIVAVALDETYSNLYEGDYNQGMTGKITKGDITIFGNTELIDALKERTGFEVTLYFNKMRLITTVERQKGGRATGTAVNEEVYAKIQNGETVFLRDAEIEGNTYYAYYQPLVNADGSVVGVIGVAKEAASVEETIRSSTTRIVAISLLVLILASLIIVMLASKMVRVMIATKEYLEQVALGELARKCDPKMAARNDELGDIYNISVQLQSELRKIVDNIKVSSSDLISSADQLTGMAMDTRSIVDGVYGSLEEITRGSTTQAEETAVANQNVEKIGEQITYITEEVDSLTMHAEQMSEAEKASEVIIGELNTSNEETSSSVSKVAEQIYTLHDSVASIQSAITMIQSIADETDLLSLNASIEAARAGEAGRGFAVVAQQISKLAEQSNNTAEEVEKIIAGIISESNKMVEIMEEVRIKMEQQQQKLNETMDKTGAVAVGVSNSLYNIESIRDKVGVLSESGEAIKDVVHSLASIAEQNEASTANTMESAHSMTGTMNELESSSEKLKNLAGELDKALSIFKM